MVSTSVSVSGEYCAEASINGTCDSTTSACFLPSGVSHADTAGIAKEEPDKGFQSRSYTETRLSGVGVITVSMHTMAVSPRIGNRAIWHSEPDVTETDTDIGESAVIRDCPCMTFFEEIGRAHV